MNRRTFGQFALSACALLCVAACTQKAPAEATPALSDIQRYEQAATATGLATGPVIAANTAYIFFDPACMHCAALWNSTKPLASRLRIVWIPVGFLTKSSQAQGAVLLAAANPLQAMNEHAAQVLNNSAVPSPPVSEMESKIKENTDMFKSLGAEGAPYILYKNLKTGRYGNYTGGMDTAQLATLLGLDLS